MNIDCAFTGKEKMTKLPRIHSNPQSTSFNVPSASLAAGKDNPAYLTDLDNIVVSSSSDGGSHVLACAGDNNAYVPEDVFPSQPGPPLSTVSTVSTISTGDVFQDVDSSSLPRRRLCHPPSEEDVQHSPVEREMKGGEVTLKRSMSLFNCVAVLVAVTGHVAIFSASSDIIRSTGSIGSSALIWFLGGLLNLSMALTYTEMGTLIPQAGGIYAFLYTAFGRYAGFFLIWGYIILIAGPFWAFATQMAAVYVVQPAFRNCTPAQLHTGMKVLAGAILLLMVGLNCVYIKYVKRVQNLLSACKILALAIIISVGVYQIMKGDPDVKERFTNIFEDSSTDPGKIALAVFYSVFAFGGWQIVSSLLEELKNPGRDLPRSVYISFFILIILFTAAHLAYFTLLTPTEVTRSSAVALLFIERFNRPLSIVISVLITLSSIGALNASVMGHTRVLFAGGRDGLLPLVVSLVHAKYLTPWPAIFTVTCLALILLYTGGVTDMMELIGLFSTTMSFCVAASCLHLRVKWPEAKRDYRVPTFIPVMQLFICVAVIALAIKEKPENIVVGIAIMASSIPAYWLGVIWRSKPRELTEIVELLTVNLQKLFQLVKTG